METKLKQYFPIIRTREEILHEIGSNDALSKKYRQWSEEQQTLFLDYCTGVRGVKLLYDAFFKEIMNPEYTPERLEEFLSFILGTKVKILKVLPNDSSRIADESSLLIMDIVVELEDHSIANVEVQKLGYAFPGQRAACYSADLLLRQYKRVRSERKEKFSYKDIKKVYTIILFEKSGKEFHKFRNEYIHLFQQKSNTGIELNLFQDFIFIALDIFSEKHHNIGIQNKLEAWLTFLCMDSPEDIIRLIEQYPEYKVLYQEVYELCQNTERVMEMFSKELLEMDRNTVQYMIDEMQDTIDAQKDTIDSQQGTIDSQQDTIDSQQQEIDLLNRKILELTQSLNKNVVQ